MSDETAERITLLTVATLHQQLQARVAVLEASVSLLQSAAPLGPPALLSVEVERALGTAAFGVPRDVAIRMRRAIVSRKAHGDADDALIRYIQHGEPSDAVVDRAESTV